jgi:SRSO17 transposase
MTPDQMIALGVAFAAYLRLFENCFVHQRTVQHLHAYCRGLLSDLPRKSIEPMALACGTAVRTLQEFLRDHVWDQLRMRDQLQQRLAQMPPDPLNDLGTIGVIDETSFAKKGTKTPGVHRQWCGSRGKVENCIVTVHLGIVRGCFKTLVDAELFLPQAWSDDRERCREAAIPEELEYRPKWCIALEQLDRAASNGLSLNWLTFDEYYGSKPAFLHELDDRPGMHYIGEVPCNFRCLGVPPRGKRPPGGWTGKRADTLARFSSAWHRQDWQGVSLARLTLANQEWEVRAAQVYLVYGGDVSKRTYWLIVARNLATGEVKYFISNAPTDTPLEKLLRVAFSRWNVEHVFRVAKSEIGFGHFEGRSYVALMRHLILCLVVTGFVAEHTERLRGEKSRDHDRASQPGLEPTLPDMAGESPGNNPNSVHDRCHRLSPAAQSGCPSFTPATTVGVLVAL